MPTPIARNDKGYRVGESHHNAKLSDHDVDLIRELAEAGLRQVTIAEKFGVGESTVRDIISCRRRAQVAARRRP